MSRFMHLRKNTQTWSSPSKSPTNQRFIESHSVSSPLTFFPSSSELRNSLTKISSDEHGHADWKISKRLCGGWYLCCEELGPLPETSRCACLLLIVHSQIHINSAVQVQRISTHTYVFSLFSSYLLRCDPPDCVVEKKTSSFPKLAYRILKIF